MNGLLQPSGHDVLAHCLAKRAVTDHTQRCIDSRFQYQPEAFKQQYRALLCHEPADRDNLVWFPRFTLNAGWRIEHVSAAWHDVHSLGVRAVSEKLLLHTVRHDNDLSQLW